MGEGINPRQKRNLNVKETDNVIDRNKVKLILEMILEKGNVMAQYNFMVDGLDYEGIVEHCLWAKQHGLLTDFKFDRHDNSFGTGLVTAKGIEFIEEVSNTGSLSGWLGYKWKYEPSIFYWIAGIIFASAFGMFLYYLDKTL